MKILVLAQVFPPRKGGSGQWLWDVYRDLPGAEVQVVAGRTDPGDDLFDQKAGVAVTRLPLDFSSWGILGIRSAAEYLRTRRQVRRIASGFGPGAIHCGKSLPEGLIASSVSRRLGIPLTVFVHGEELTLGASSGELRRLTRYVLHRADTVIANSHHTKQILAEAWAVPDDRVAVMYPGVDTRRFVPSPPSADARRRLGWSGRRVVLTVGALQKRKGQDMMIRALPSIRERCPDVLYSIAGEGWERPYLERLTVECGVVDAVQFRGVPTQEELVECYQQCEVFALPNRRVGWDFEGFGIVLLEAQACGKPVVAGRSGGTAETMQPSCTGELVPCETPEPLADAIAALLLDEGRRAALGANARRWAVDQFAHDRLSQRASQVLLSARRGDARR